LSVPSFSSSLNGKTVVITGAGNGIGLSALQAFHDSGANIIAHLGKNQDYAQRVDSSIKCFSGNLIDRSEQDAFVQFALQESEQIDVLVNNAGTMFGRFPADTLSDDEYSDIVELNQTSVVRITRGLIPRLALPTNSSIINTVSISASTGGSPGSSIYSASKAFVSTYTKALARELAPRGIRVNAISPGVIATDFHQRYSNAEKLEKTRLQIPLQRLGTAEDCAPAFLFLASNEMSGYITGQVMEINGGLY